jgi:hypothetical protein
MKLVIYIFSWKKVTSNAIKIYDEVSKVHQEVWLLNCEENFKIERENVIQADDSYYFGKQMYTCLQHRKSNYNEEYAFMNIVGDVTPEADWRSIIDRIIYGFDYLKAGIVAPNVEVCGHPERYEEYKDNYWLVKNTDCTTWALHPIIANFLLVNDILKISKFGWGYDWLTIKYCNKKGLYVLRDYNNIVYQPPGTNYPSDKAEREFKKIKYLWYNKYDNLPTELNFSGKIHFGSFASQNMFKSLKRIKNEAISSNFFDNIHCLSNSDIQDFIDKHQYFINDNSRGYGLWIWKPYCVKKILEKMNDGDILVYLDSGCTINKDGAEFFRYYIEKCIKSPYKNLSFQYSDYTEKDYTKPLIFDRLKIDEKHQSTGQLIGGMFILQKSFFTMNLVNKWLDFSEQYDLIDNTGFDNNRNDQSIFSCLRKKYGTCAVQNLVDLSESGVEAYQKIKYSPFWATRLR